MAFRSAAGAADEPCSSSSSSSCGEEDEERRSKAAAAKGMQRFVEEGMEAARYQAAARLSSQVYVSPHEELPKQKKKRRHRRVSRNDSLDLVWRIEHAGVLPRMSQNWGNGVVRWRRWYAVARSRTGTRRELLLFNHHDDTSPKIVQEVDKGVEVRPLSVQERATLGTNFGVALCHNLALSRRARQQHTFAVSTSFPWIFLCLNSDHETRWLRALGGSGDDNRSPAHEQQQQQQLNEIGTIRVQVSRLELVDAETKKREHGKATLELSERKGVDSSPEAVLRKKKWTFRLLRDDKFRVKTHLAKSIDAKLRRRRERIDKRLQKGKRGSASSEEDDDSSQDESSNHFDDPMALRRPLFCRVALVDDANVTVAEYSSEPLTSLGSDVGLDATLPVRSSLSKILLELRLLPRSLETRPSRKGYSFRRREKSANDEPTFVPGEIRAFRIVPLHEVSIRDAQRLLRPVRKQLDEFLVAANLRKVPVEDEDVALLDKRFHIYDEFHALKPEAASGFVVRNPTATTPPTRQPGSSGPPIERCLERAPIGCAWYALQQTTNVRQGKERKNRDFSATLKPTLSRILASFTSQRKQQKKIRKKRGGLGVQAFLAAPPPLAKPCAIAMCQLDYTQRLGSLLTREPRNDVPPPELPDYNKLVDYLARAAALIDRFNAFTRSFDDVLMWRFPERSLIAYVFVVSSSLLLGSRRAFSLFPLAAACLLLVTLLGRIREEHTRHIIMPTFPTAPLAKVQDVANKSAASDPLDEYPELRQYRRTAFLRVAILKGRNLDAVNMFGGGSDPYVRLTYRYARALRPLAIGRTRVCTSTVDPIWQELRFPANCNVVPRTLMNSEEKVDNDDPQQPQQRRRRPSGFETTITWAVRKTSSFAYMSGWLRVTARKLRAVAGLRGNKTVVEQMEFHSPWHRSDGGFYASAFRVPILWPIDESGTLLSDFSKCDGRLHLQVFDADSIESGDMPTMVDELIGQVAVPVSTIPSGPPWTSSVGDRDGWIPLKGKKDGDKDASQSSDAVDATPTALDPSTNSVVRFESRREDGSGAKKKSKKKESAEPHGALQVHCSLELPPDEAAQEWRRPGRSAWAQMLTLERVLECPLREAGTSARPSMMKRVADTYVKAIDVQYRLRQTVRLGEQLTSLVTWAQPSYTLPFFLAVLIAFVVFLVLPTRWVLFYGATFLFLNGWSKKKRNEALGKPQPWQPGGRQVPSYKRRLYNLLESLPCAPDVQSTLREQRYGYLHDFERHCDRSELLATWAGTLYVARSKKRWKRRYAAVRNRRILLWRSREEALVGLVHRGMIPLAPGFRIRQVAHATCVLVIYGHNEPSHQTRQQIVVAAANSVEALELKIGLEREAAAVGDICRMPLLRRITTSDDPGLGHYRHGLEKDEEEEKIPEYLASDGGKDEVVWDPAESNSPTDLI